MKTMSNVCNDCGNLKKNCTCGPAENANRCDVCKRKVNKLFTVGSDEFKKDVCLNDWNKLAINTRALQGMSRIKMDDLLYLEACAEKSGFPLIDMPLHLKAANKKNMTLDDYLATLPRNRKEFEAQGGFDRLRELMT